MTNILHLIDALNAGGSERVAVNLANELALRGYHIALCATRRGGPLQTLISPKVEYFCLNRKTRFDLLAIFRLANYLRKQRVQIIHAHSSSLLMALMAKLVYPQVKVIWHDHFGASTLQKRSPLLYWILNQRVDGIITVNQALADWSVNTLRVPLTKVWILSNFIIEKHVDAYTELPGQKSFRIVCVAHLRPQKDHLTLTRAMKYVIEKEPLAHLILIGRDYFPDYANIVWSEIIRLGLTKNITWLGEREDVQNILAGCSIGVLSSASEGLPLALLDYGLVGLAVVSTNVGECALVLDSGDAGILVPPQSPVDLANGILFLINNPDLAVEKGRKLQHRVRNTYSSTRALDRLEYIYAQVMESSDA